MSNLVIVVISIAILALVSGAMYFYGGDIYKEQKISAESAKYINQAQQVNAAYIAYKADGKVITPSFETSELKEQGYLKEIPLGWDIYPGLLGTKISGSEDLKQSVCYEVNKNAGFEFDASEDNVKPLISEASKAIPYCNKEGIEKVPCCYQ
ncbi:hypothetical protein ACXHQ0_15430 [Vibrio antiquarius]|uniref:Uncharacterized protein n=1 Tax=Vibrio parahaemolyticus TaxID=670 RepID=A0A8H9TK95_VIBPH|nr:MULTISPECIES: hypothetical protein [Vibrio harveyi group]EJG0764842.1 hypothetical protein [Vibrio parahaemolyticus O5:K30]EGR3229514.1 hypothetical protein [Vibrio parahaemolyticus]EGR5926872.1 hypothetical protein [Vibrio parahaemolyticus]EJG0181588.1 hypothetical protein [Vibrio parahaemolyticus]KOY41579.1 hypothetical protein ACX10_00340 [Vibrio parahaemolyticus]